MQDPKENVYRKKVFGRRQSRPLKCDTLEIYNRLMLKLKIDLKTFIAPKAPLWLEIGFGGGEHLAAQALMNPKVNFIGCEPYVNGVGSLLKHVDADNLNNIIIHDGVARDLIAKLPENSLDGLFLLFADPWPKKRHHKRRFIQKEMIERLHEILKPGAFFKIATDHVQYRQWILQHFSQVPDLFNLINKDIYDRPSEEVWPKTRYESYATEEGRISGFMVYECIK